jgi:hypothetical protein
MLEATKVLRFEDRDGGFDVHCGIDLRLKESAGQSESSGGVAQFVCGLETVINLLAPNVPDRYIEFAGGRKPLEWSGTVDGSNVRLADEWQDVAVHVEASGAQQLWIAPIETVSESEEGFERVYQGSQILGAWNVSLSAQEPFHAETVLHVTRARTD